MSRAGWVTVAGVTVDPSDFVTIRDIIRSHTDDFQVLILALQALERGAANLWAGANLSEVVGVAVFVMGLDVCRILDAEHPLVFALHAAAVKVLEVACHSCRVYCTNLNQSATELLTECLFGLLPLYRMHAAAPMNELLDTFNCCVEGKVYPNAKMDGGAGYFTRLITALVEADFPETAQPFVVRIVMSISRHTCASTIRVRDMSIYELAVGAATHYLRQYGIPSLDLITPNGPAIEGPGVQSVLMGLGVVKYKDETAPFTNPALVRDVFQCVAQILRHRNLVASGLRRVAWDALRRLLMFELGMRTAVEEGVGLLLCDLAPLALTTNKNQDGGSYLVFVHIISDADAGFYEQFLRTGALEAILSLPSARAYRYALMQMLKNIFQQARSNRRPSFTFELYQTTLPYLLTYMYSEAGDPIDYDYADGRRYLRWYFDDKE